MRHHVFGCFPMSGSLTRALALSAAALLLAGGPSLAQQQKPFEPTVSQAGKDVVWVPTPQALVDRMLDMAKVTVDDYVVDLGSGDGRTVITAAKRGVKAHGIEYNPDMVALSKYNAEQAGVSELASFAQGDIFESKFSDATVVTLFLLQDLNVRLRPTLLDMKPGTRVVSNTFSMGDWEPDGKISAGSTYKSFCSAMLWIIPAKVAGTWKLAEGELTLEQKYQKLTGTLKSGGNSTAISDAKMQGDQITFKVGDRIFRGRVDGNKMEGVFATETKWEATRG